MHHCSVCLACMYACSQKQSYGEFFEEKEKRKGLKENKRLVKKTKPGYPTYQSILYLLRVLPNISVNTILVHEILVVCTTNISC